MVPTAAASPRDFLTVIFSDSRQVARMVVTMKLNCTIGETMVASPSRNAASSEVFPNMKQTAVANPCAQPFFENCGPPCTANE